MNSVKNAVVKEYIEALQILHGSTLKPASLTELAKIYGVSRQNLTNWMSIAPEKMKFFDFLEKGRKDLGWDEKKVYNKVIKNR